MEKNLKLYFIFFFFILLSTMMSCQSSGPAFDAMESAAYTFSLVNETEGWIKDVDILTEDGTISHPCGRMSPHDKCIKRFAKKPDVLRILYKADPVMGMGMKFDQNNIEQIWKFHRPSNGKTETYNLALDEDYFSLTATNLSETPGKFIDGFAFNNFDDPMEVGDYEYISEYLNTNNEIVEHDGRSINAILFNDNITPGTFGIYTDDDNDPMTPAVQVGSDDGAGQIFGAAIKSGTIDYESGQIIVSMKSDPPGEITCSYHSPLGMNEEYHESPKFIPVVGETIDHVSTVNMHYLNNTKVQPGSLVLYYNIKDMGGFFLEPTSGLDVGNHILPDISPSTPIKAGSFELFVGGVAVGSDAYDKGVGKTGTITGPGINGGAIINYETGEISSLVLMENPQDKAVTCNYVFKTAADDGAGNIIPLFNGVQEGGTVNYYSGKITFEVSTESNVICDYNSITVFLPSSNKAWLGFYKKSDLDDMIRDIYILQRNSSGFILGYWDFHIDHSNEFTDLRLNKFGTYFLDLVCTEDGFN